jgi:hypothetical protein
MTVRIDIRKLGSHWYPSLRHDDPNDLSLDLKMERKLSEHDYMDIGSVTVYLHKAHNIIGSKGIVQFEEQDIVRYLTTDEDFIMRMYIDDEPYYISSQLYFLLENIYNLDFRNNLYKIELW